METELPQPTYRIDTPAAGWWKAPSSIGTDPAFLRVDEKYRLGAVGLYISSIGWCQVHNSSNGWVPKAAILSGQVIAGEKQQLVETAEALVLAGIWSEARLEGLEGFVVAGAAKAVQERFARQENARRAGQVSAQMKTSQSGDQREYKKRSQRVDANTKVDWTSVSSEL